MNEETIAKFDVIPIKTAKWKKLENAPINVEKIKWQHGDNFITNNENRRSKPINFLAKRSGTQYAFEYHYCMDHGILEWGTNTGKGSLDRYYMRHGFLMPRIAVTNSRAAVSRRGFSNLLGGFILNDTSRIFIRSEQLKEDF